MITSNDIQIIDCETISYIDEYNITYQYETWVPMTLSELEDAKSQFAMILNLLIDNPVKSIETHMKLNGFDGIADVYNNMERKKRPVGRPTTGMKGIYVKLRGSLVKPLVKVSNRNGFINDAIQSKLKDDGLLK